MNQNQDKIERNSDKNPWQSEHHVALGVIPEMELDVIPAFPQSGIRFLNIKRD